MAQYAQKLAAISLGRSSVKATPIAAPVSKLPAPVDEDDEESEGGEDEDERSAGDECDGWEDRPNQPTGRKAETKEEKKLRKQAVITYSLTLIHL